MPDAVTLDTSKLKQFGRALSLAPKRIPGAIRRKLKTGGNKIAKDQRARLFEGGKGINLPARKVKKLKGGGLRVLKSRVRKKGPVQKAHLISKVNRRGSPILVHYLSRFATFHKAKLEALFRAIFRRGVRGLVQEVKKEVERITRAVLNQGLTDRGTR